VLDVLADEGVEIAFGYPGGAIMPLYDALYDHAVRHILVRHEAAAAFAASGYARTTGRVGVCVATSGPGATNLLTGIADAMLDNIPLVALTGQVRNMARGTDAFQEVDIVGAAQGFTKYSAVVTCVEDLEPTLRRAFRVARGPRPGPVLVDLPTDVLKASCAAPDPKPAPSFEPLQCAATGVEATIAFLARSRKPLLIVGGGTRWSGAVDAYREFCARTGVPHCSTLHGLGAAHPDDARFLGMAGMHGTKRANLAIEEADCIVALGMRFDDRITGDPKRFAPNARIIVHADIDPTEFGKSVRCDIALHGDVHATLNALNEAAERATFPSYDEWLMQIQGVTESLPRDPAQNTHLSATDTLDAFFAALPPDAIVTTDVGQHQMWAAQRARPRDARSFLSSGGLGSMGFGLPAAIGAQLAHPERPVFCVVGDGGFQMSMAELATLRRYDLPVKILLIDNAYLGLVRQWQTIFFDARHSETHLPENPDFGIIASAYGIRTERVESGADLASVMRRFARSPGAGLLHCSCHPHENVWPMIPSGTSVAQMLDAVPA
jgi:acetolactate synthase-1/2/3 large subunit